MRLSELRAHLFTAPAYPASVPYRTSYYEEHWGFCLSERQLSQFDDQLEYEVLIDSSLKEGHLTYGEHFLPGQEEKEVLVSCHICHPSLANDNLSGVAVAVALAQQLAGMSRRYSYRFLFIPGTIGSITWLARNEEALSRIQHGLVLTCVGDASHLTYKRSRRGNAEIDRAFVNVLKHSGEPHRVIDFFPYGYDERQYCSPGVNLPVGCLMRARHGEFPEYHTSADNLDFVRSEALADSLTKSLAVIEVLETNRVYLNKKPKGEPQLGKRGLYGGAKTKGKDRELALLWVLNLSDGDHSLLDIAERADLPFAAIKEAAAALATTDLLVPLGHPMNAP
jgi:aminopeptidase-like protein